jgi:hypothetical protein
MKRRQASHDAIANNSAENVCDFCVFGYVGGGGKRGEVFAKLRY